MYSKGHLKIKYFLGVTLGIIASLLFFPVSVNAESEECGFSDNFDRNVKNECMYMEQWPVQNIKKGDITIEKKFSIVLTDSAITSNLTKLDKQAIVDEFAAQPIGWTQGSTVTKNYFVFSLHSDKRKSYLAVLDKNYNLVKLLKENVLNEWGHMHSLWNVPGTDIVRIDVDHSGNASGDYRDQCFDLAPVAKTSTLIENAKSYKQSSCSSTAVPDHRSNGKDGLVYQADAVYYSDAKKRYNYTLLWDAGAKSWLERSAWLSQGVKTRCTGNDKNCIYQHESEGMHYSRHNKAIAIKDASDGMIVKTLYISHKALDGEPEGISFDSNGDIIMTSIKKETNNGASVPYITVSRIAKAVHQPSFINEDLKNWFSTSAATMVEKAIKMSEEVTAAERAVICNTNNLSESDHLFCVKNIYNRIKKAIQLDSASTIPSIRQSTTRKLFNEAVAKFKKAKYIKAILTNIKTTKITAKTIESFKHDTIIDVLSDMLAAGGTQTKCAVKYFNKVSESFAKEMIAGFEKRGTFSILRDHSWTDRTRLTKVAYSIDSNIVTKNTALLAVSIKEPAIVLAAKKSAAPTDETLEENDAEDQDGSSSDDDIDMNVNIQTNDDEKAPTIEEKSWQDDTLVDDEDEDYAGLYGKNGGTDGGDNDGDSDTDVPATSCDPSVEGDCEVYDGGFGQTTSNADICSTDGVPEAVKSAAGCTNLGEDSLGNKFAGIINIIISVIAIVAVVGIIYGGIQYMTAQGDPGKIKTAKNTIIYCAVGLGIVALSAAIVNWVISIT